MSNSDINLSSGLTNFLQGVLGGQTAQTSSTPKTPMPGDSIASIDLSKLLLDVGQSGSKPDLSSPNQDLIFSNPSPFSNISKTNTQDTTFVSKGDLQQDLGAEAMVDHILSSFPEFVDFMQFTKTKGQDKQQEVKQNIMQALQKLPPPVTASKIRALAGNAVAQMLLQMLKNASPDDQEALGNLLNQVRLSNLSQNQPSLNFLVASASQDLQQKGLSPSEANNQAVEQLLQQIDDHLSEMGVNNLVLSDHSKLSAAVTKILQEYLQNIFGNNLAGSILAGSMQINSYASTAFSRGIQTVIAVNKTVEVSPTEMNAKMTAVVEGASKTINDQINALVKASQDLGVAGDEVQSSSEWMRTIALITAKVQHLINEMQLENTKNIKEILANKTDVSQRSMEATVKKIAETIKQLTTPKPWWMTLLMVFFAVVIAVVSVIGTPFTGGASLAALVAITTVLLAATTALTETGVMDKMMQGLLKAVASVLSKIMPESAANAIVAALMVIVAIIIAVISHGAATGIVGNLSGEVAGATASAVMKQVGMQMIATAVTSSNLMNYLAVACTSDPKMQAILTAVFSVIFVAVTLVAAIKIAQSTAASLSKLMDGGGLTQFQLIQNRITPVLSSLATVGQATLDCYNAVINIQKAHVGEKIAELDKIIMLLKDLLKTLTNLLQSFEQSNTNLGDTVKTLNDSFNRTVQVMNNTLSGIFAA